MFKKLLPHATPEQLLKHGTDFPFEGRFLDTLSYNHFTWKDYENMKTVADLLETSIEDAIDLFTSYLNDIREKDGQPVSREEVQEYLSIFLHAERTKEYVISIIRFFHLLRVRRYNVGKLIVAFNQLNFFFITFLMSKKGMFPYKCMELLETLQRATNIDQQVLIIEVYTENLIEAASEGIARMMDKNAEIIYIKDLLKKMGLQSELSQNVAAATEQLAASIDEVARNAAAVAEKTEEAVQKTESGKNVIVRALEEIIRSDRNFHGD